MKISKEKRDQLIASIMGTVMLVVAGWMFLITPSVKKLKMTAAKSEENEKTLQAHRKLLVERSQVEIELQAVSKRLQELEAQMVSGDPSIWIRERLNEFRAQAPYGVDIRTISQATEGEMGMLPDFGYKAMIFGATGLAFYHDLGRFLGDFENRYPYVRVQNLIVNPDNTLGFDGPDREKLAFQFEIVVLIKPIPKS